MLRRGDEIRHLTVWADVNAIFESTGEKTKGFVFVTLNLDIAQRAKKLLDDAGLLCQTDLGNCDEFLGGTSGGDMLMSASNSGPHWCPACG